MNGGGIIVVCLFVVIFLALLAMVSDPDSAASECYDNGGVFMPSTYQCIGEDK